MIRKAVIPAAGYGTRNLPVTKAIPKEMFPVCGKPALHYVVDEAAGAGISEILIIVSRGKDAIMDYFDKSIELELHLQKRGKPGTLADVQFPQVHFQYVRQPEALGLGSAVLLAESFAANEPFALLLPDDVYVDGADTLYSMIRAFEMYKRPVIGLRRLEDETQLRSYGVIEKAALDSELIQITGLVEKPQYNPPSNLAVFGRYVLPPEIFGFIQNTSPGHGGEIQLTDALKAWLHRSEMYGIEIKERCYDISKVNEYIELQRHVHQRLSEGKERI